MTIEEKITIYLL